MQIAPIKNYQYSPNFTSTTRTKYYSHTQGEFFLPRYDRALQKRSSFEEDECVRMVSSNSTEFFRIDFPWKDIGKTFKKHFPKGKVNIYDFGCSDGSEAYSLIIALIEQLGYKKAKRFFPIKASDVDPEIIRMAKAKTISASAKDILEINKNIKKGDIRKYFQITQLSEEKFILSPKEILLKNVSFECKGINDALDDVEREDNNIILCRNFWKYLTKDDLAQSSWKLAEKTSEKTLVVIGGFDCDLKDEIPFFMRDMGLEKTKKQGERNVILKINKEIPKHPTLDNKKEWENSVKRRHWGFVPNYLKY